MQYEAHSITSKVLQLKVFNLNPIKLSDLTPRIQELVTIRKQSDKSRRWEFYLNWPALFSKSMSF